MGKGRKLYFLCFIFLLSLGSNSFANNAPLINAVNQNAKQKLINLLRADYEVDSKGPNGMTALMQASFLGREEMVRILLLSNSDPNIVNDAGVTPLHFVARKDHNKIIDLLVKNGANLNVRDFSGYTPLMRAIDNQSIASIRNLLKYSPDLLVTNNNKHTALEIAVRNKFLPVVRQITSNYTYSNITHLESMLDLATQLGLEQVKEIIAHEIRIIRANYIALMEKNNLRSKDISGVTEIVDLQKFPCVNEYEFKQRIAENLCLHISDKYLLYVNPISGFSGHRTPDLMERQILSPYILPVSDREWLGELFPNPIAKSTESVFQNQNIVNAIPLSQDVMNIMPFQKKFNQAISNVPNIPNVSQFLDVTMQDIADMTPTAVIKDIEWRINPNYVPIDIIDKKIFNKKKNANKYNNEKKIPEISEISNIFSDSSSPMVIAKQNMMQVKALKQIKNPVLTKKGYFIQIASFRNINNASKLKGVAKRFGNSYMDHKMVKGIKIYRVILGPFKDYNLAKRITSSKAFIQEFGQKTLIKKY